MLTLMDMMALSSITPLDKAVMYTIVKASPLAERIPFEEVGDLQITTLEARDLPAPSYGPLNPTSVPVVSVSWQNRSQTLKLIRDKIPIDQQLVGNASSFVNIETAAIEQYTKGVAYELARLFLRGDPGSNPDQPAGLEYLFLTDSRLSNGTTNPATQKQVVDAANQNSDMTVAADQLKLVNGLHTLMSLVEGGADIFITNRQVYLKIGEALRAQRLFSQVKDQFGRFITTFGDGGPMIIDAGYTASGAKARGTQVIPTGTSQDDIITDAVIAVKFGKTLLTGLQKGPLQTKQYPVDGNSFPNRITTFEWAHSPCAVVNPFSTALLRRAA